MMTRKEAGLFADAIMGPHHAGERYWDETRRGVSLVITEMVARLGVDAGDVIVSGLIPLDGPDNANTTRAAAGVLGELVRRLNHATLPARDGVPDMPTLVAVYTALESANVGTVQLLGQLLGQLVNWMEDGERLGIEGNPDHPPVHSSVRCISQSTVRAVDLVVDAVDQLTSIRSHVDRLTLEGTG